MKRNCLAAMLATIMAGSAATAAPQGDDQALVQSAEITLTQKYLLYPIKNGAPKSEVSLSVDGKEVRLYTAALAGNAEEVAWWAFEDVSEYTGGKAVLAVMGITGEGFGLIRQSDTVPGSETWGSESFRPQFHISQKVGWINDPNGMVYQDGEWHVFFQHNPVGLKWGNMTWGHVVSKDLIHWTQLPNALHHRRGPDAMFSGGAAIDGKNTAGWKTGDQDVLFITWTSTGRGECIAFSNDGGRTFTEYEGNPIIRHKGRDPKPLWYSYGKGETALSERAAGLGGHWVIAVYDEDPQAGKNIAIYTSTDLKSWTVQSRLPGYYECPELFSLPVDGKEDDLRWVIFSGDARYAIGRFDGRTFTPEHEGKHTLHHGRGCDYFASQLFSEAPDNRRIQVGWLRNFNADGVPFSQGFSFPTELTLRSTPAGVRMFGNPVREIEQIHRDKQAVHDKPLAEGRPVRLNTSGALLDIRATIELGQARRIGINIDDKRTFIYDVPAQKMDGAPVTPVDGRVSVRFLVDRGIIEAFVNDGEAVISGPFQGDLDIGAVEAFAEGGDARLVSLEAIKLEASWKGSGE